MLDVIILVLSSKIFINIRRYRLYTLYIILFLSNNKKYKIDYF